MRSGRALKGNCNAWSQLAGNSVGRIGPGGGGGGGGALRYIGGCIRSLSNSKDTSKAPISGQISTLILIKTLTFSSK